MCSLALAALSALAVVVDCQCPKSVIYEPLNKTMWRLEFNGSLSWRDMDSACNDQFPGGFEMLSRDFLHLSEADRALCRDQVVPLGLQKDGLEPIVWRTHEYIDNEEEVNSIYLALLRGDEEATGYRVGALDLVTNQWRLVHENTTFTCAICQRAWIDDKGWFRVYSLGRQTPLKEVNNRKIKQKGQEEDPYFKLIGQQSSGKEVIQIGDHGGHKWSSLRMKRSRSSMPLLIAEGLPTDQLDHRECPATRLDGFAWAKTWTGFAAKTMLPDFRLAAKRCMWYKGRGDGGFAFWDDAVSLWIDSKEQCRNQSFGNFVSQIGDYNAQAGADRADLKELAKIMVSLADVRRSADSLYSVGNNVSRLVFSALSRLVAKETSSNASHACEGLACAFLIADRQGADSPDTLVFNSDDLPPKFVNSKRVGAAQETPSVSLQLPSAMTSAGHVAISTVQMEYDAIFISHNISVFQEKSFIHTTMLSNRPVLVHLTSSRTLAEWMAEGSRPVVSFLVNNTKTHFLVRYLSVWSLGENEESTLPCLLVSSEGSIDTYSCDKFVSGPHNFTTGAFLALSGSRSLNYPSLESTHSVFHGYSTATDDDIVLQVLAKLINKEIEDVAARLYVNDFLKRQATILGALEQILSGVIVKTPVFTASHRHVKILVSKLTVSDPVIGFSLGSLVGASRVRTVTAVKRNVSSEAAADLVLGAQLERYCDQIAFLAVSNFSDFYPNGTLGAYISRKLMVVHLVLTQRNGTDSSVQSMYFDIQLHGDKVNEAEGEVEDKEETNHVDVERRYLSDKVNLTANNKSNRRFLVATWSETVSDWSVSTCAKLRSTRALKQVFRCEQLTFAGNEFRGRYLVFEPSRFADALGGTLIGILVTAGVLSGVSLASIAGTTAVLASWRQDLGHKILLQMTLALSGNLALGFVSSLVSVDTAGTACVGIGALRHFFYLAMFAWMLVMSDLQLRRLLSVFGARTTPNLLLKVSCPAWGVPAVAVVALVSFKKDIYLSDAADRGFCYPEGTAFRWLVQFPAAAVLILNTAIFVVILARLYNIRGWGKTQDLRSHQDDHVFQLRRLRAVFFTFCLFGISWVFHLLAEQGVFQEKYLYEYLFLMTASVHVFSLSCIFVFFEHETQAEWLKVISSLRKRLSF